MENRFEQAWVAAHFTDDLTIKTTADLSAHAVEKSEHVCLYINDKQIKNHPNAPFEEQPITVLTTDAGITFSAMPETVFRSLKNQCELAQITFPPVSLSALQNMLEDASFSLLPADYIYYQLPEQTPPQTSDFWPAELTWRALTEQDSDAFAGFTAHIDAEELGNAWVQLAHWQVFGLFLNGELVSACSAYPWHFVAQTHCSTTEKNRAAPETNAAQPNNTAAIADIGIVTLPAYRGKGFAKQLMTVAAAQLAELGYIVQCRIQSDNLPAIHLAESLGLPFLGVCENIAPV